VEDIILGARKLCHDLNQPLTVVMARSELLMMKLSSDDANYKSVEQIHQQAEKMSEIIESLRDLLKSHGQD
jgi:signal transduction histidine kinase